MRQPESSWEARLSNLKSLSQRWPEIHKAEYFDGTVSLSTMVRIYRDQKWYLVHCVESANSNFEGYSLELLYRRLVRSVHLTQTLHVITGQRWDEKDNIQIPEKDRVMNLYQK